MGAGRVRVRDLGPFVTDRGSRLLAVLALGTSAMAMSVAVAPPASASGLPLTWELETAYPAAGVSALSGISCPTTTECLGVGLANGANVVAVSQNAGTSWVTTDVPDSAGEAPDISCPSASTCFEVGDQALLETTDAGTTWSSFGLPAGQPDDYRSVSCPSTEDCVAVGTNDPNTYTGAVAVSTNGGATWATPGILAGQLESVSCADTSDCVAVGTDINSDPASFFTTDGGSSWTEGVLPVSTGSLSSVSCVSSTCVATDGQVITSSNDGLTWTVVLDEPTGQSLDGVSCSGSACLAVGTGPSDTGVAYFSSDGGSTWTESNLPLGSGPLGVVSCASAQQCAAGGVSNTVLATADGGASWSQGSLAGTVGQVQSLSCPRVSDCVGVAYDSNFAQPTIVTVDDGVTTNELQVGSGDLYSVSCATTAFCMAVGVQSSLSGYPAAEAVVTTDGGSSWEQVSGNLPSLPPAYLLGVSCPAAGVCEAVGEPYYSGVAVVLGTTDGGNTWTLQDAPSGFNALGAVSCPTTSTCIAAALGGTLDVPTAVTSDGGAAWTNASDVPGMQSVRSISCATSWNCVVAGVGTNGFPATATTTDSAGSWFEVELPNTNGLEDVSCATVDECVAVSGDGISASYAIASTADDGATWNEQELSAPIEYPYAISCAAATACTLAVATSTGLELFTSNPVGATTTAVQTSATDVPSGREVTYGAQVAGSGATPPTGSVSFSVGTTSLCTAALSEGSGTCRAANAPEGIDTVTAYYSGDASNDPSSATTTLTVGAPAVSAVSPDAIGDGATDVPILVTGAGFSGKVGVSIGTAGVTLTGARVTSSTTIRAHVSVAAGAADGPTDVTVTLGKNSDVCAACLTVDPAPSLSGVTPTAVAQGSSGLVTFDGTGFVTGATLRFPGVGNTVKASAVRVESAGTIQATIEVAPGATVGDVAVTVTNPDHGAVQCATCFSVAPAATLTSLSPSDVARGDAVPVTIVGSGFAPPLRVSGPSGVRFSEVVVVDADEITTTLTVLASATPGTDLPVTVRDSSPGFYARATGDVLTIS